MLPGVKHNLRLDLVYRLPLDQRLSVGDVTVRHPYSPTGLITDVLEKAAREKTKKYGSACEQQGVKLEVLAVDQYGRFNKALSNLVFAMAQNHQLQENLEDNIPGINWAAPSINEHLTQRISCCLQRNLGIKELQLLCAGHVDSLAGGIPPSLKGKWYAFV